MSQSSRQNLVIVPGGMYAKRDPRSYVMRQCALELRERIVALMAGRKKSRKLGRVQAGVTQPLGEPLKLAADLKDARVGFADSWRTVITPQARALAMMHHMDFRTGDFEPPNAPAQQRREAA